MIRWTKYRTADGRRWFCIWRQTGGNVSDAMHVPLDPERRIPIVTGLRASDVRRQ